MTNAEQRRLTHWRLKLLQAATMPGWGAHLPAFRTFTEDVLQMAERYHQHGDAWLADRARAPHYSPGATPAAVVSKILYLRQHYHFGPGRLPTI